MIFVYITCSDEEEARKIAWVLVEEKLAACVNILPSMTSIYEWEGRIEEESEFVLIAKTEISKFSELEEKVKALHSYDVPCICALNVAQVSQEFEGWVESQLE